MKPLYKIAIFALLSFGFIAVLWVAVQGSTMEVLDPRGFIAENEKKLIITAVLLMLIVVVPVIILAAFFGYWYRASNEKAHYTPNWEHGVLSELVWWAIPFEIILVLGALTWTSTHELDPPRRILGGEPMIVQVVALNWKWLFIYPEEDVASAGELRIPVDVPVEFHITAEAPMNSFWIPRLGGQIYAMTGMDTKLNLIADRIGVYNGLSANYSGEGFAKMKFKAHVVSRVDFERWVESVRTSPTKLSMNAYSKLSENGTLDQPLYYAAVEDGMYNSIVMKYMTAPKREPAH